MSNPKEIAEELREIALWFDSRNDKDNANFQFAAAEIVDAAVDFFGWFNKTYKIVNEHNQHPLNRLGCALYAMQKKDFACEKDCGAYGCDAGCIKLG